MRELMVPSDLRRGGLRARPEEYVQSGADLIALICRTLGLPDLGTSAVLDMGCGTKMTQAFIGRDLPIRRYVGMDVFSDMIDYLSAEVRDPRFGFHHLDFQNDMYNPGGQMLGAGSILPVPEASFDIVCLFSVFTHLAPHDYVAMLKLLRRYIKSDGTLIFSLYVNEKTEGGHGLIDGVSRTLAEQQGSEPPRPEPGDIPDFVDAGSSTLQWALYSRKHALELLEGTGWQVQSLNDPEPCIQHYFICTPD